MREIYLIRHGKTEANLLHLYCGSTDLPLSPQGMDELRTLHYSLPQMRYITSGMLRTEQTLEMLFGKVSHQVDPLFREIDFGKFEMRSYEQLKNDPEYQHWLTGDNFRNVPPGGESGEVMTRRVMAGFHAIETDEIPTVIVTHGGVIAAIMESLFPGEGKNRYAWQPQPGHGYAILGNRYHPIPITEGD